MSSITNNKLCSIIYFLVKNSKYLYKTKLIKLLYLTYYEYHKYFNKEISGAWIVNTLRTIYFKYIISYTPEIKTFKEQYSF